MVSYTTGTIHVYTCCVYFTAYKGNVMDIKGISTKNKSNENEVTLFRCKTLVIQCNIHGVIVIQCKTRGHSMQKSWSLGAKVMVIQCKFMVFQCKSHGHSMHKKSWSFNAKVSHGHSMQKSFHGHSMQK